MMKYLMNWQAWLIAGALAGCGGADAANGGVVDVGVEMALTSASSGNGAGKALVADEAEGGEVEIAHARAIVERIELYLPTGHDESESADDKGGSGGGKGGDDSSHSGKDDSTDDAADDKGVDSSDDAADDKGVDSSDDVADDKGDDMSDDDSATGNGDKITIRGPFIIDLVDGSSTPSIADIKVPAGHYRRVDVRFSNDGHGKLGANDPLNGNTFVADGTFTPNGGEAMPFSVALDFNEEARFESKAGFDISAQAASDVLLKLDISSWFSALPVSECAESGAIAIDEKSSCHFEQDLKDAIKSSGRLEHR